MGTYEIPRIIFRLGNITFSKNFIDLLKSKNVRISRANRYIRDAVVLNHGNSNSFTLSSRVKRFYLINKPSSIKYCSNKWLNYEILHDFYPRTQLSTDKDIRLNFPILAKPLNGHHGYGIVIINDSKMLESIANSKTVYILQDYINIKHEFRFNVFNRQVFQVSHKERTEDKTGKGGFIFNYRSLGEHAKLKKRFWEFVHNVIHTFHLTIPVEDLGSYCIDVMKDFNGNYYLSEMNSAYGIGEYTFNKLLGRIYNTWEEDRLARFRVI